MQGYDIIGDVHGHAAELKALLAKMDYVNTGGAWRHPEGRKAVFLGDLIDRGPEIREVLETVKAMTDAGSAYVVLGNHELNALHITMNDPVTGRRLRNISPSHCHQFEETVKQLGTDLFACLDWFRSLPAWLLLKDSAGVPLRFVHACWHEALMHEVYETPLEDGTLRFSGPFEAPVFTEAGLIDFGRKKHPATNKSALGHRVKETIHTGPEVALQKGAGFRDKDGTERNAVRVCWWRTPDEYTTLKEMIFAGSKSVDKVELGAGKTPFIEVAKAYFPVPVEGLTFVGHYWLDPQDKKDCCPLTPLLACLDFSVARDGALMAYRHNDGMTKISPDGFVSVAAVKQA